MTRLTETDRAASIEPETPRFGWWLLAALLIEAIALAGLMFAPHGKPAHRVRPATIAVHMLKPVGPPKAIPLPPKLVQPPPVPPKPTPVLPKPPPPLPQHPHIPVPRKPPPRPVHHVLRHVPVRQVAPPPVAPTPPAPPAPRVTAPPPSPAQVATALSKYTGMLRDEIISRIVVPNSLRALGARGVAMIEFDVTPGGRILWARVLKASDYQAATKAALAAVQDSHFPAFLAKMPQRNTVFQIPITVSGNG